LKPEFNNNAEIEEILESYPDLCADAMERWKVAELECQKIEALRYLEYKASGNKKTSDELKAMVRVDPGVYQASLAEIQAEVEYNRLYEKLMSAKKISSLRTAY